MDYKATTPQRTFSAEETAELRNYWLHKLAAPIRPANIRLDFQRPPIYQPNNGRFEFQADPELSRKLMNLTHNEPFLLYSVLVTALNILLFKYREQSPLILGSPALKTGEDSNFGNNAVLIINEIDPASSFRELLLKVRDNLVQSYQRQDYPLSEIICDLKLDGAGAKCPIFDVAVVLKNIHYELPDYKNDLTISFEKTGDSISGSVTYHQSLYRQGTIAIMIRHLWNVLEAATADTNITIAALSLLTESEKNRLLVDWNITAKSYSREKSIHQLFEAQAIQKPNAVALVYGNQKLSFRELNEKANQLAHYLKKKGVGPDVLVGLFINRSLEMIIGLLGILKAGGAFVPLDPTYPKDRLTVMLETGKFPVLISVSNLLERLPAYDSQLVCLDRDQVAIAAESSTNPSEVSEPNHLAYAIFTSGSTGTPKGGAVYHQGWTNLLYWFSQEFVITAADKVLIISSFSFDITLRAIAMPLINGGELHLLASDYYEPELIKETISQNSISIINCSPSTFYPLIENKAGYGSIDSLRWLFLGGEAISAARLIHFATSPGCKTRIANVYGAAECSDVSSFYILKDFATYAASSVPIGKPIYNTQVYVLDEELKPVLTGSIGEICIAGDGVGRGYFNDPGLTAQKFVDNPFLNLHDNQRAPSAKLYRTGDLGRFLPDDNLEFIGRVDHQIKIRGLRIDLGDVEAGIRQHPLVKEIVVLDKELAIGDKRLIAYVVPRQPQSFEEASAAASESGNATSQGNFQPLIAELQQFAKEKLPGYMVPNIFMILEKMPLSPNGKVDRQALPVPDLAGSIPVENGVQPLNNLEAELVKIFTGTLNVAKVGVDQNFFQMGGHSLMATQVIAKVNEVFQVKLSQVDLLAAPTVTGLAKRIEAKGGKLS